MKHYCNVIHSVTRLLFLFKTQLIIIVYNKHRIDRQGIQTTPLDTWVILSSCLSHIYIIKKRLLSQW